MSKQCQDCRYSSNVITDEDVIVGCFKKGEFKTALTPACEEFKNKNKSKTDE